MSTLPDTAGVTVGKTRCAAVHANKQPSQKARKRNNRREGAGVARGRTHWTGGQEATITERAPASRVVRHASLHGSATAAITERAPAWSDNAGVTRSRIRWTAQQRKCSHRRKSVGVVGQCRRHAGSDALGYTAVHKAAMGVDRPRGRTMPASRVVRYAGLHGGAKHNLRRKSIGVVGQCRCHAGSDTLDCTAAPNTTFAERALAWLDNAAVTRGRIRWTARRRQTSHGRRSATSSASRWTPPGSQTRACSPPPRRCPARSVHNRQPPIQEGTRRTMSASQTERNHTSVGLFRLACWQSQGTRCARWQSQGRCCA